MGEMWRGRQGAKAPGRWEPSGEHGCGVPGIMASRTIRNERERRATAMLTPFMPCGAKIPVIALFAGSFFDGAGWVSAVMYLFGIVLMFNLYTPPCFAAIGAMNSEMKSAKWVWGGIGLQMGVGYTAAYLVYTIGTLISASGMLNVGAAIVGFVAVAFIVAVVAMLVRRTDEQLKAEYALTA